jgi:GAF domain-containing protein
VLTTEEAALRHVAILVARGAPALDVFDAVAEQVARIFGRPWVGVMQYDSAESFVVVATWGEHPLPVGSRWPLDGPSPFVDVLRTGRPVAVGDYAGLPGTVARAAREAGIVGGVAAPIVVDGSTWGVVAVPATRDAPIPAGVEARLSVFTELAATAVSNADARESRSRLADEQAALGRVATLVARESSPPEIFGAVTEEARRVLACEAVGLLRFAADETATLVAQSETPWEPPPLGTRFALDGENVVTELFRTGRTVRRDDWTGATGAVAAMATVLGVRSAVACPVVVEGRLWGAIIAAASQAEPLPAATESWLGQFTGLVATAIANAQARGELSQLAEEQAALRRVAVLVAQQPSPDEVFAAVTEVVGPLLGADLSAMHVFRDDGVATVVASWTQAGPTLPVGTELPLDGDSAVARIFRTAAAARIDGYAGAEGGTADVARGLRLRSTVGAPILVEGELWGALMAATRGEEPLPADAEARIAAFTELVATAVSNAQAREEVHSLADEQAALRRVATLVAEDAPPAELFHAVAVELGTLLGAEFSGLARFDDGAVVPLAVWSAGDEHPRLPERWPLQPGDPATMVAEGQRSVRVDDWSELPGPIAAYIRDELAVRSSVVTPIVVEGRVWGCVAAHSRHVLPRRSESRLLQFSDLVATAVGNAEARGEIARLAGEQAALRRIATLVAGGAKPEQVFTAVSEETAATFEAIAIIVRFEHDPPASVVVGLSRDIGIPLGSRWPFAEGLAATEVYRTGRSARLSAVDWTSRTGPFPDAARRAEVRSHVSSPILVEGNLWGVISLSASEELPADTEQRLENFAELVTTAIANAEAGLALRAVADEQGALRRVATLVAASAAPSDVFAAVTEEIARVLGADASLLCRADAGGAAVVVGAWGENTPTLGTRLPQGGTNLTTLVLETARPARIERYEDASGAASEVARSHGLRSAVGAPILVEGRLWGLVIAGTQGDDPLPPQAEERLAGFTELVATAISNTDARVALRDAADEQGALRRVATLVATAAPPSEVFAAVTKEVALVLGANASLLCSADADGAVVVGTWADNASAAPPGFRIPRGGTNLTTIVLDTGRPARIDNYDDATGEGADVAHSQGVRSAVGAPIMVDGGLWGLVVVGSTADEPLPSDAEERLVAFTELVATAISNATARAELVASRARIVAAGDEARRRIERNLHDGTQQRLIALGLDLQRARSSIPDDQAEARSALVGAEDDLEAILVDLRELSHGLHPPLLARAGLRPSLRALARRSPIPVAVEFDLPARPSPAVEIAVYYVVSEALTNAIKHSRASSISVSVTADHGEGVFALDLLGHRAGAHVYATIADDGVGGAKAGAGSGLTGLADRAEALGGRLDVESPVGQGTRVSVDLPVELPELV